MAVPGKVIAGAALLAVGLSAVSLRDNSAGKRPRTPRGRRGGRGSGEPSRIVDRTAHARFSAKAAPHVRERDPSTVYAVVLHQMGFSRGSDPARYDSTTAHYKVMPSGLIVESHPWSTRLPAADGFNTGSVSIEFVGNLPGRFESTNPKDFWRPEAMGMNQLTDAQIESGRWLLRHLRSKGITHVLAHSQSAEKPYDPGPDIWFHIGQYGVEELGMDDGGPGFSVGNGRPIEDYWRRGPGLVA